MYRGRFNGKAASGTAATGHAEDSQPNESINKRKQIAPPRIATVAPPRKSNIGWRGSYRGRGGWPQTAIRGDKGWRGGRGGSSLRGGHRSSGIYTTDSGQDGSGGIHFSTFRTAASTPQTWNSTPMEYFMHQFSTQSSTQLPRVPQEQGETGRPLFTTFTMTASPPRSVTPSNSTPMEYFMHQFSTQNSTQLPRVLQEQGETGGPHFTTLTTMASPPRSLSPSNSSPKQTMSRNLSPQNDTELPNVSQPRYHPPLPRKTASSTQNPMQPYNPHFARHSSSPPLNEVTFNHELQRPLSPRPITPDLPPLKRRKLDIEHEIPVKEGAEEVPPPKPKPQLPKRSTRSGSAAFSPTPFSSMQPPKSHPLEKELSPQVKPEPSSLSPPPPPPSRRLITESCTLFPLPDNCRKSHPNFHQNRKDLFHQKISWLAGFGLKKTKVFFRDDGMVVEWCALPLLPPPSVPFSGQRPKLTLVVIVGRVPSLFGLTPFCLKHPAWRW